MLPTSPPSIELLGVQLHGIDERACVEWVARAWERGEGGWIHTINVDHLRRMKRTAFFDEVGPRPDVAVADGMPLIWASRLQGTPLPARVAGSDLIFSLTQEAAKGGRRIYFLGGNPGTAEATRARLAELHPGFVTAGVECPAPGFERDPEALAALTRRLVDASPDLVFVAVGAPKSERLIQRWRASVPGAWWIGVGISFSFVAGELGRAPRAMQRLGLEWVHRLWQEPRRLVGRYLGAGVPFAFVLFTRSLAKRFAPASKGPEGAPTRPR